MILKTRLWWKSRRYLEHSFSRFYETHLIYRPLISNLTWPGSEYFLAYACLSAYAYILEDTYAYMQFWTYMFMLGLSKYPSFMYALHVFLAPTFNFKMLWYGFCNITVITSRTHILTKLYDLFWRFKCPIFISTDLFMNK